MKSPRAWLMAGIGILVGAVMVAIPVAFWWGDDESGDTARGSGPTLAADGTELASDAASVGHVVFWAGPMAGRRYELTQTEDGRAYVRYLPPGVEAGDTRPGFLTVGTYLLEDAFAVTRATSRRKDSRAVRAPAGAVAFYSLNRPQSVYLAFQGSDLQIEVFHPTPQTARRLVTTGRIRPVG